MSTPANESPSSEPGLSGTPVTAPMVGTIYLAPSPDAAPFVKVGDKVKAGDTLLIIEAMKVMNPIKAAIAGTISKILVADTKPVEFGEALMMIE
jgi:acetyl-CoA carboxylase biotin carboxyl carrier protein